jgi:hypothetical protein
MGEAVVGAALFAFLAKGAGLESTSSPPSPSKKSLGLASLRANQGLLRRSMPRGTDGTITLVLRIRDASSARAVEDSGPSRRDSFAVPFWESAASTASRSPPQPPYLPQDKPLARYHLTNTKNVL